MPNHLASETSPYLLQHKDNPVDWYPWGPEALQRAKQQQQPIFLSIGYSACHWCHVMEHESFENEAIARLLNESFVCIKVDREERPDLDQVYMNAVQMLTGRGGWPMSVFLTPDLKPFFGGTYWPPQRKGGMPGFDEVVTAMARVWATDREQATSMADKLTAELAKLDQRHEEGELSAGHLSAAARALQNSFDRSYGGFGGAPKFPSSMALQFLMRHWHRKQEASSLEMVRLTLDRMAAGGIYDHVGGGFARYSVDARWLVPHFEKMLYDNALLAATYLEAYQATRDQNYGRIARETLDYVLRDMTGDGGGFYSTEDADSEGVEGKFYVWTPAQLEEVLGPEAAQTFARVYDVTAAGNFEHANILNLPKTLEEQARLLGRDQHDLAAELDTSRAKLFATRETRTHPPKDDKVIVAWNGLMIDTMARAGVVFDESRYVEAAIKAADFLLSDVRRDDGRLLHTWRGGQAKLDAYLDDYTCLANGLVSLYEATFEGRYLDEAAALVEIVLEHFSDADGGFFFTAADQEELIVRNKDFADNAVPSGNSMAATVLVRLGKLTGKQEYLQAAEAALLPSVDLMRRAPVAAGQSLIALNLLLGPTYEIVLAGDTAEEETRRVLSDLNRRYLPNKVLALASESGASNLPPALLADLLVGKSKSEGTVTLYVCEGHTCQAPAQGKEEIAHVLDELMPPKLFD
ncbi:MAG: thioredoxin domain-containing protein [Planctomycetales bacterium]|nr:thioredoxin domain-containing protein [Planctomycetales bacterium]